MGSLCHVEGVISGDADIETITSVTAELTATPAQWKDIRRLQIAFFRCDISETYDPKIKKACVLSRKLQDKLAKQEFCTYKHILVGRLAWHGPEEDRVSGWPEGEKQCYALHEPTP